MKKIRIDKKEQKGKRNIGRKNEREKKEKEGKKENKNIKTKL